MNIRDFTPGHTEQRGLVKVQRAVIEPDGGMWRFSVDLVPSAAGDGVYVYLHGSIIRMLWFDDVILPAACGKLLDVAFKDDPEARLPDGRTLATMGASELFEVVG